MVKSVTPIAGVDVEAIFEANVAGGGNTVNTQQTFESGTTIWADDGHQYIYATCGNTPITANATTIYNEANGRMSVQATGEWTSPATDMASGDGGWFRKTAI